MGPGATASARISFSASICASPAVKLWIAGRRIGKLAGIGHIRNDRCGIDDAASGFHVAYSRLGEIKHRVNVDFEGQLPFLVTDILDRLEAGLMRRVVDEDIDAAELRNGFGHNSPAMNGVLDVTRNKRPSAGVGDQPFGRASSCSSR
jgi:hypothetical protein